MLHRFNPRQRSKREAADTGASSRKPEAAPRLFVLQYRLIVYAVMTALRGWPDHGPALLGLAGSRTMSHRSGRIQQHCSVSDNGPVIPAYPFVTQVRGLQPYVVIIFRV